MRRALAIIMAISLAACARTTGPSTTIPAGSLAPGEGLDFAAARASSFAFLRAYAGEPHDHGVALLSLVDGPVIEEWAHWLAVQNDEFPGTIEGSLRVVSVGPALPTQLEGAQALKIDIRATVTFLNTPTQGAPTRIVRNLDGPLTLVPAGPGMWRVRSFTRDGVALERFVVPIGQAAVRQGVAVRLDVLIVGPGQLQFGAVVSNTTRDAVRLQPKTITLVAQGGKPVGSGQAITTLSEPIPAGAAREALVAIQPLSQSDPTPVALRIGLVARGGKAITLEVPLAAPSTGSGSGQPSPSG